MAAAANRSESASGGGQLGANEGSKGLKEKTTKAERRALQEAQRAAKVFECAMAITSGEDEEPRAAYIMHEVTRVLLGASSVLSNGTVYSRVGTACVAMVAHAFRVPVLVCCEAYKFHERVQLDSICFNELGNPDKISTVHGREDISYLDACTNSENLQLLNLIYDATPSDYVSMIITDFDMVPPTSVPVIVRVYQRTFAHVDCS